MYNDLMKDLIHQFKYDQKTGLKYLFIELIDNFIKKYNLDINQFDLIMPIPLCATRKRERGYNQSQLLAEMLSKLYNISLNINNLYKLKTTQSQALLNRKERWTNINGAFRIKSSLKLKDKSILIVDDLITTGATVSEAAKALKKSGVKLVGVLSLAITL